MVYKYNCSLCEMENIQKKTLVQNSNYLTNYTEYISIAFIKTNESSVILIMWW